MTYKKFFNAIITKKVAEGFRPSATVNVVDLEYNGCDASPEYLFEAEVVEHEIEYTVLGYVNENGVEVLTSGRKEEIA